MTTLALAPTAAPSLSALAERLLDFLRASRLRWVVLDQAHRLGAADLSAEEFELALDELEAADLVERAFYGPLLFIR